MKRNHLYILGGLAVLALPILVYAATGTIFTLTGKGSRRGTVEVTLESPTLGSAANWNPGNDNTNSLGTSSVRWKDIYSAGLNVDAPTTYTISTNTVMVPTSSFCILNSSGGALTWAGTPSISTASSVAYDGNTIMLMSTGAAITLTDAAGLQLSTTTTSLTRVLTSKGDNIVLRAYGNVWYEVSYSTGHQ